MEYDNPVFYKHYKKPFAWTTMKWQRVGQNQSCLVSGGLAEVLGWKWRSSKHRPPDLIMGPLRLRVMSLNNWNNVLTCERASGPFEESTRAVLFRIKELAVSAFQYYFGPKPTWQ